jgi:hypothetical protein
MLVQRYQVPFVFCCYRTNNVFFSKLLASASQPEYSGVYLFRMGLVASIRYVPKQETVFPERYKLNFYILGLHPLVREDVT